MIKKVCYWLCMPYRMIKNLCYKIKIERQYKKRIAEMKKKDPFIYK